MKLGDAPPFLDFETVLARGLGDIRGLRVADMGSGGGEVTRRLARLGADVTGVEPQAAALETALGAGGGASYVRAGAEATGLPGEAFDLVVFSKSLHHCPDMDAALAEARRILRPGGRIAVLEPVSPDPFWPVIRHIEDETEAHRRAIAAMERLAATTDLRPVARLEFATRMRNEGLDQLIARLLAVDPGRSLRPEDRPAMACDFAAACLEDETGRYIPHWNRLDVFARCRR